MRQFLAYRNAVLNGECKGDGVREGCNLVPPEFVIRVHKKLWVSHDYGRRARTTWLAASPSGRNRWGISRYSSIFARGSILRYAQRAETGGNGAGFHEILSHRPSIKPRAKCAKCMPSGRKRCGIPRNSIAASLY
jgi:hypothetical protein